MRKKIIGLGVLCFFCNACSFSFKGFSIDYSIYKSIQIENFQNRAPKAPGAIGITFGDDLRREFRKETKMIVVDREPTIHIEGQVTRYTPDEPVNITSNDQASQSKFTISVKVKCTDNINPDRDFEKDFSAYRNYDNSQPFMNVQETLTQEIFEDITNQIISTTTSTW